MCAWASLTQEEPTHKIQRRNGRNIQLFCDRTPDRTIVQRSKISEYPTVEISKYPTAECIEGSNHRNIETPEDRTPVAPFRPPVQLKPKGVRSMRKPAQGVKQTSRQAANCCCCCRYATAAVVVAAIIVVTVGSGSPSWRWRCWCWCWFVLALVLVLVLGLGVTV